LHIWRLLKSIAPASESGRYNGETRCGLIQNASFAIGLLLAEENPHPLKNAKDAAPREKPRVGRMPLEAQGKPALQVLS
jgi:hypothetical protein